MGKIIRLTESDLTRIIKRVISEGNEEYIKKIFTEKVLENKSDILSELQDDEKTTLDKIESEMRELFPEYYKINVSYSGFNNEGKIIYSIFLEVFLTPEDLKLGKKLRVNQIIKTQGPESWGFRYM